MMQFLLCEYNLYYIVKLVSAKYKCVQNHYHYLSDLYFQFSIKRITSK